jgi:hypothetical protein
MSRQIVTRLLVLTAVVYTAQPVQAQNFKGLESRWGPALAIDNYKDSWTGETLTNLGASLLFYDAISDAFHGFATVDAFSGKEGTKAGPLYAIGSVVFAISPMGQSEGLRPFVGAGVEFAGMEQWSPLISVGVNKVGERSDALVPFAQLEYFTSSSRIAVKLGVLFSSD